ncbi:MAG TPA: prolipoprotein diacylglyceryl transferase family protein [Fimbriimonadaceae bacterium]|nr:prolipoprotein diacylglyceryl transferase family protein [Fimbriimonadaceae bacterium]
MSVGEVFTALGYLVGALVLVWGAMQKRLATDGMGWVALSGFAGGVLGAKLTELIFEGWPLRVPFLAGLDPRAGGRALFGGMVCGWIAVEIAKRRLGIRRSTGDLFALALPAGEAVGRIGCYFNGCCYGTTCDEPWAVYQHGAMRHPAQLYSSVTAALIFVGLLWIKKRIAREGDLFKLYLLAFGASRFVLEFYRQNDTYWFGLTPMQWFCLDLILFGVVALARARRQVLAQ